MPPRTLVVDNGAYTIKAGFVTKSPSYNDCYLIPNCIARSRDRRSLVGTQLESCRDFGGMAFRRPVEKGYLVNWEAQKEIWDRTFLDTDSPLHCDPHNTSLILTEAPNAPLSLQNNCDQMVFEEYEFSSYLRCVAPALIPWNDIPALLSSLSAPTKNAPPVTTTTPAEAALVIDSGHSHTHIVPMLYGSPWNSAVRRIDIGGKFLTNYLKELVSIRTWNMMEEPYLISQVKEAVCFVSTDFSRDLEKCKRLRNAQNDIVLEYVLPDYNTGKGGFARKKGQQQQQQQHGGKTAAPTTTTSTAPASSTPTTSTTSSTGTTAAATTTAATSKNSKAKEKGGPDEDQIMVLANERFTVPELLFNPADVGLKQAGVAECVLQSLETVPERFRPVLLANIVLVGGNAAIPGFRERFEQELRPLAPAEAIVRVAVPPDPIRYSWLGGARMAWAMDSAQECGDDAAAMARRRVSRKEYMENGLAWAQKKMAGEDVRGGGEVKETWMEKDRRENRSHKKRKITGGDSA